MKPIPTCKKCKCIIQRNWTGEFEGDKIQGVWICWFCLLDNEKNNHNRRKKFLK